MSQDKVNRLRGEIDRIEGRIHEYKWLCGWNPKIPVAVGMVTVIILSVVFWIPILGVLFGGAVVLSLYLISIYEVNKNATPIVNTFAEFEQVHLANQIQDVRNIFSFTYETNNSPPGVNESDRYRMNVVLLTRESVCVVLGSEFDVVNRHRKDPFDFQEVYFDEIDHIGANEDPETGELELVLQYNGDESISFKSVEKDKIWDAVSAIQEMVQVTASQGGNDVEVPA